MDQIDHEIRASPSIVVFKSMLLPLIRSRSSSVFGICDPHWLALLTQLRVDQSKLIPVCPINDGTEDTEHYLLLCHSFCVQRHDLLASVVPVLRSFDLMFPSPILLQFFVW